MHYDGVALASPQSLQAAPSTVIRLQLVSPTGMGRAVMILSQHRPNSEVTNFCGKSWGIFYVGELTSWVREYAIPFRTDATYVIDYG